MTPQIKQRIEQIRRGEVPAGYKKTKTGIMPIEWTVCNMGDIYSERKESGNPTLPILTVSIHSGVSDGELDEAELGKKVKRIEDKTKYLTARKGDLVFNMMRAWQGAVGVVRTDGLVSPAYIVANPNEKLYPAFMNEYMMLPSTINRLHKKSYGVTDFRLRLYWDSFVKVECCIPTLAEQDLIAEILTVQDRVIELCEKKVEQLKKLKKVFLQKMFPKPGATVPEWRFPWFTAAWEQRKLGEVLVEYNDTCENDGTFEHVSLTTQGVVPKTKRYDRDQLVKHDDKKYRVTHANDICYNPANLKFGVICRNKYGDGIFSPIYVTFKVKDDTLPSFIETVVTRYDFIEKALQYQQGTVYERMAVGPETLLKIEVALPDIKEQKTIGMFFESLDNLITLHQRKCDEEKQKKKALMQLLLTGIVRVKV